MSKHSPLAIRVIDFAIAGIILRIKKLQEEKVLIQLYGHTAVYDINFYTPGDDKKNLYMIHEGDHSNQIQELQEMAAGLQRMRDTYFDNQFSAAMEQFTEELRKNFK